jgi:hypothetical protein
MPSESRRPYVALTPNWQADFSLQPLADASSSSTSITSFLPDPSIVPNSRWRSVLHNVQEFLSLNAGLLLVIAAQVVFSLVNAAVKILQNLDEPVSTLEVCEYDESFSLPIDYRFLVDCRAHGELFTYITATTSRIFSKSITYICSVTYMLIQEVPHPFIGPEGVRRLLVFRGVAGFVAHVLSPPNEHLKQLVDSSGSTEPISRYSISRSRM